MTFALFALVLLLTFILENGKSVSIGYFGAHRDLPLGAAFLLAAVFGVLRVVIRGTARITQLGIVSHTATGAWTLKRRHHRRRAQPVMQCFPVKLTEPRKSRGGWPDAVVADSEPAGFRPRPAAAVPIRS